VTIGSEPLTLSAPEPLEVVTSGAHLLIDISELIENKELLAVRSEVDRKFPSGCVRASMTQEGAEPVVLDQQFVSWSEEAVYLMLASDAPISEDLVFSTGTVSSCNPIEHTSVIWVNYTY
jgi:hypothetical protein